MALARQPTPCKVWRSHMMTKQYKAGIGWERWSRHNEGVYSTLCLRRVESCNISNLFLNLATVDVPGVIISLLWRPCNHGLYLFGHNLYCLYRSPKSSTSQKQNRQVRLSVLLRYRLLCVRERLFISAWALTLSVQPK